MSTDPRTTHRYLLSLLVLAASLGAAACTDAETPQGGGSVGTGAAAGNGGVPAVGGAPGGGSTAGGADSGGQMTGGQPAGGSDAGGQPGGLGGLGSGGDSGGIGGSGAGGAPLVSPPGFFSGGYLTSGPWQGWVFTYADSLGAGSTISPTCDSKGCTPSWGAMACAKGSVGADPSSASFAGLAFHVNNPMSGGTGTWKTTGVGLKIVVSNPPPGARFQLQEPNTSSNDQRYCAPLPAGGSGVVLWSDFKTYCWGDKAHPSKSLAVGTELHEAAVTVPGNSTAATPFDFCLVEVTPQ